VTSLSPATPTPLRRTSVVDELREALAARILDGDPAPGRPLREVDVAERYGVSRHTVRAALRALAADGLVQLEPNRGAVVAALDREGLLGLWELRTALETEAARLALDRAPAALHSTLREAVARLTDACSRRPEDRHAVDRAHDGVHAAIVEAAGSPRIARAYAALATEQRLFLLQLRDAWSLERMVEHHRTLARRLETGDVDAVREHLREGATALLGEPSPRAAAR
jgi:DNA-binding GntR family transcriptional regulator